MTNGHRGILTATQKNYKITSDYSIVSPRGRRLKLMKDHKGYLLFHVYSSEDKKIYPVLVHRFIAFKKFGDAIFQTGIEVRHLDNNSQNNNPNNLALGTRRENILDIPEDRRKEIAKNAGQSKTGFSTSDIIHIREDRSQGMTLRAIARKYNVKNPQCIHKIVKRETFNDIP